MKYVQCPYRSGRAGLERPWRGIALLQPVVAFGFLQPAQAQKGEITGVGQGETVEMTAHGPVCRLCQTDRDARRSRRRGEDDEGRQRGAELLADPAGR